MHSTACFQVYAQTLTARGPCPCAYLDTECCRCSSAPTCPHRTLPHWVEQDLCKCVNASAHHDRSVRYRETSLSTMTSLRSLCVPKKGWKEKDEQIQEWKLSYISAPELLHHRGSLKSNNESLIRKKKNIWGVFTKMINGVFPSVYFFLWFVA